MFSVILNLLILLKNSKKKHSWVFCIKFDTLQWQLKELYRMTPKSSKQDTAFKVRPPRSNKAQKSNVQLDSISLLLFNKCAKFNAKSLTKSVLFRFFLKIKKVKNGKNMDFFTSNPLKAHSH